MDQAERLRLNEQLARLADGDRDAFHPVFVALAPVLRRFVRRHLDGPEAEDVAQDTLVKVFARASQFDRERDALAWILGIAVWEVRTARRKRQRRREESLEPKASSLRPDPAPTPEEAAIARALDATLDEALSALSPRDRETLRAYARDERTSGVGAAAFRKRVERGLARLRRIVAPAGTRHDRR